MKGKSCSVEIVLSNGTETTGTKFLYGSESMGPPPPVGKFVLKAIKLTDPWYNQNQKAIKKNTRKWWQFWKRK
jgi:hypothetical protein